MNKFQDKPLDPNDVQKLLEILVRRIMKQAAQRGTPPRELLGAVINGFGNVLGAMFSPQITADLLDAYVQHLRQSVPELPAPSCEQ